jgi:transcriptional regulator with XRE-family HTH domain
MHGDALHLCEGTFVTPDSMAKARRALGTWLAGKRKVAGQSRAQVAELIGQNEAFVGRYEAGSKLGLVDFGKIIEVLGAEPEEVIGAQGILAGNPSPPPSPSRGEGEDSSPQRHNITSPL